MIEPGAGRGALGRAEHDPHRKADAQCGNGEEDGVGERLGDDFRHRSAEGERMSQIPPRQVPEIAQVLLVQRPVEPPGTTVLGSHFR